MKYKILFRDFEKYFKLLSEIRSYVTPPEIYSFLRRQTKKEKIALYRFTQEEIIRVTDLVKILKLSHYKLKLLMKDLQIFNYYQLSQYYDINIQRYVNRNGKRWSLERRKKQISPIDLSLLKKRILRAHSLNKINSIKELRLFFVTKNSIKPFGEVKFYRCLRENNISVYSLLKDLKIFFNHRPSIGRNEDRFIKEIELSNNIKIERGYFVRGKESFYYLDGYVPSLNLAIEIDEEHHYKNNKLREVDKRRQKDIEKILHCSFIRIKDGAR